MDDNVTLAQVLEAKDKLKNDIFHLINDFYETYGVWPQVVVGKIEVERIGDRPQCFPNVKISIEV